MSTAPEPQIQYVTLSMTHSSVEDQSANNPNRDLLNKPKSELTYVHPLHWIYPLLPSHVVFLITSNHLSLDLGSFCLIVGLAGFAYRARISETLRPTSSHSSAGCAKHI